MKLIKAVSLLAVVLSAAGCRFSPRPVADPCDPNPCTEENRGVCIKQDADDYQCACNEGFVQRPTGVCEAVTAANCPEHTGDAAEPDDCAARAKLFAPDEEVRSQSIEPVGDYDFFRIEAAAKRIYAVGVNASGSTVYPRIDLFDHSGKWLDFVEYDPSPADATLHQQPTLFFKNRGQSDSPFYVRVTHSPKDASVGTGAYNIQLTSPGLDDKADTIEEGPFRITAEVNTSSAISLRAGLLEYPYDQDLFVFSASPTHTYTLDFTSDTTPLPAVAVYPLNDFANATPVVTAQSKTFNFKVTEAADYVIVVYMNPPKFEQHYYKFALVY